MSQRRAAVGLLLLCALVLCAFAAPSASAKGTTAFTCEPAVVGEFSDEHCLTAKSGEGWKHKEITPGTATEFEGTNEKTAQTTTASSEPLFLILLSGIGFEITCEKASATGILKNEAGPPMKIKFEKVKLQFTNCFVIGVLLELGCKISGGKIETGELSAETKENSMNTEFKPEGKSIATFKLEGCSEAGLNIEYELTGNFKAIPEGATWRTSSLLSTGLKIGASQGALFNSITLRMKGGGNPISATTTAT